MRRIKNDFRILQKGQQVGTVVTPRGNMRIIEHIKSCGADTGFMPSQFYYVQIPDDRGSVFTLRKGFVQHWHNQGFETEIDWHLIANPTKLQKILGQKGE